MPTITGTRKKVTKPRWITVSRGRWNEMMKAHGKGLAEFRTEIFTPPVTLYYSDTGKNNPMDEEQFFMIWENFVGPSGKICDYGDYFEYRYNAEAVRW